MMRSVICAGGGSAWSEASAEPLCGALQAMQPSLSF